jgi:argininosuccinate synthase
VLLTAQILEQASIIRIKMRTPPPIVKANFRNLVDEDEEITILYHNGKVVSIDGQSLWMVLRVCDGQRESGIGKTLRPTLRVVVPAIKIGS